MKVKRLFAIVHESNVPLNSPQAREIARIKRDENWIAVPDDLTLHPKEIEERHEVYICGAYSLHCVKTHFEMARTARGHLRGTFIYEPATFSILESQEYL